MPQRIQFPLKLRNYELWWTERDDHGQLSNVVYYALVSISFKMVGQIRQKFPFGIILHYVLITVRYLILMLYLHHIHLFPTNYGQSAWNSVKVQPMDRPPKCRTAEIDCTSSELHALPPKFAGKKVYMIHYLVGP